MEKNIEELTLLLMYLSSWEEDGYTTDENYLYFSKGQSVSITPKGEEMAKKLVAKYIK